MRNWEKEEQANLSRNFLQKVIVKEIRVVAGKESGVMKRFLSYGRNNTIFE